MYQKNLDDVDFERRCVWVIGKGNKRRDIYFSVRAKLMIRQYVAERIGGTALFCCGHRPYDRLGKRSIEYTIQKIGER